MSVTSHPRTPGGPLLLKEANYRVGLRRPDGRVEAAFEVDIGEIGLPGRPSALDPPVSVTLRGADADELAEVLKEKPADGSSVLDRSALVSDTGQVSSTRLFKIRPYSR